MNNEPTVSIYLIDQETKRKLLFKVNPIMVGKAENTTIVMPDGIEYKLVEAEPSDLFKTNKFFEEHEYILEEAAAQFPDFGYPEKPVPSKEEQIVAISSILEEKFKEPSKESSTAWNNMVDLWNSSEDNKKMISEVGYQKLGQWVTTNRSMVYARKLQEERWTDPVFCMDYAIRIKDAFQKVNDAIIGNIKNISFIEAIQTLGSVFSDIHTDYRNQAGKLMLMETIKYYEPVQVMYRPIIERIVELHRKGDNVMLNEERPADGENAIAIDKGFWNAFAECISNALIKAIDNKLDIEKMKNELKDIEDPVRVLSINTCKILNDYLVKYNEYNKEAQLIGTDKSDKDIQTLTKDIFENGIGNLIRNISDVDLKYALHQSNFEEYKESYIDEVLTSIVGTLPMLIQHNQNPTVTLSTTYETCTKFKNNLMEAAKITDEDIANFSK